MAELNRKTGDDLQASINIYLGTRAGNGLVIRKIS